MLPELDANGLLPEGVHWSNWEELAGRYGYNMHRRMLLVGLWAALQNLKAAGCRTVWLNGSFVTSKKEPNDFDACWDETGVDPELLDPVLLTFDRERAAQKAKYMGEMFPSTTVANLGGWSFLDFFQTDRETGRRKGIVAIDLGGLE